MANKFQIKRTAVSGREANTSVIDVGELALNITDGIMYSTNGSVVFEIGSNLTNQAVASNSTANNITANNVTTGNLNVDYIKFLTVDAPLVAASQIELPLDGGLLFNVDGDNVFRVAFNSVYPAANSTIDLGLTTNRWDELFVDDVTVTANISAVNLSGNGASVTSVNAAAVGGNTASTLLSRANHTGTQLLSTISDAGTIASQDSTNVNIDGGAIDNTPIGASTANTGTFSTLVASGLTYPTSDGSSGQVLTTNGTGTLTFTTVSGGGATNLTDSANSTTVTIASDTGTDAVLDGANATTAGVLTAVTQTIGGDKTFSNNITVSAGKTISGNGVNITSVNAAAVGGNTASTLLSRANHTDTQTLSTISDAGTMASQDATSVNIDGGNIDGTPIGVSSASSGAFTTLTASANANFDSGTLFVDASADAVGIGTTSPDKKLDIFASNNPRARVGGSTGFPGFEAKASTFDPFELTQSASDGTCYVYTNANVPIVFHTNVLERMRITSSGDVGIGVTNPSEKLFVAGSIATSTLFKTNRSNAAAATAGSSLELQIDGTTYAAIRQPSAEALAFYRGSGGTTETMRIDSNGNLGIGVSPNSGFITGNKVEIDAGSLGTTATNLSSAILLDANDGNLTTLQTYNYRVSNGSSHTTSEWRTQRIVDVTRMGYVGFGSDYTALGTSNTERMRIDSSGNLLVGTTTTPSSSNIKQVLAKTGDCYLQIASGTTGGVLLGASGATMLFYNYTGAVGSESYTERMRMDASGNVAIGTTSSSAKLHVNTSTDTYGLFVTDGTYSGGLVPSSASGGLILYNGVAQPLAFWTNNQERMRIDSSGNVGIGNTSPTAKLHVQGTGLFADTLTLSSDYTETVSSSTNSTTINLDNGTIFKITITSATTITLPSSVAGKSFVIIMDWQANKSITWTGGTSIEWPGGSAPTLTSSSGKVDILSFFQDGSVTFGIPVALDFS